MLDGFAFRIILGQPIAGLLRGFEHHQDVRLFIDPDRVHAIASGDFLPMIPLLHNWHGLHCAAYNSPTLHCAGRHAFVAGEIAAAVAIVRDALCRSGRNGQQDYR
jgi:hypothetical protein